MFVTIKRFEVWVDMDRFILELRFYFFNYFIIIIIFFFFMVWSADIMYLILTTMDAYIEFFVDNLTSLHIELLTWNSKIILAN